MDRERWAELKPVFADAVRRRTLAEWEASLGGTDACYAPVLRPVDEHGGVRQPAPAPRFSRTPASLGHLPAHAGEAHGRGAH
jgi:alpha-methylacyl-CoA racemase